MTEIDVAAARRALEQGLRALGSDEDAAAEMGEALARKVQLHRAIDVGLGEDGFHTSERSITLLRWWLESIGAVEPEREGSWVEPAEASPTVVTWDEQRA